MKNATSIIILFLLLFQAATNAVSAVPTVDEVLAYTPERQFEYLSKPDPDSNAYYKNNREEYVKLLLGIAAQENAASEMAMYAFNNYILTISSIPNHPEFVALSNSSQVNQLLSQIIMQSHHDIKARRGAILAHTNLFEPSVELIQFYTYEINKAALNERGMVESMLRALEKYNSKYGTPIPEQVNSKLPTLTMHHSESVQSQAIRMLAKHKGKAYLPELFAMLESNNYGAIPSQIIVHTILSLDPSLTTVEHLRTIKANVKSSLVQKLIDQSIQPQSIEKYNRNKANKSSNLTGAQNAPSS